MNVQACIFEACPARGYHILMKHALYRAAIQQCHSIVQLQAFHLALALDIYIGISAIAHDLYIRSCTCACRPDQQFCYTQRKLQAMKCC